MDTGTFAVATPAEPAVVTGTPVLSEELRWCLRRHLGSYDVPRTVDTPSGLSRLPIGTPYEVGLRDEYQEAAS